MSICAKMAYIASISKIWSCRARSLKVDGSLHALLFGDILAVSRANPAIDQGGGQTKVVETLADSAAQVSLGRMDLRP